MLQKLTTHVDVDVDDDCLSYTSGIFTCNGLKRQHFSEAVHFSFPMNGASVLADFPVVEVILNDTWLTYDKYIMFS